jgi:hypothetical protein
MALATVVAAVRVQESVGRSRSWLVACGINVARGVAGVAAFAPSSQSSSLLVRDGCTRTPSHLASHSLTICVPM